MPRDAVGIVEAAWCPLADDAQWLSGLADAARVFEADAGVLTYLVVPNGQRVAAVGTAGDWSRAHDIAIRTVAAQLPSPAYEHVFSPTEVAGNAAWRVLRVSRERAFDAATLFADQQHALSTTWACISGDAARRAVMLAIPSRAQLTKQVAKALGLAGAHIAAALRLRQVLGPTEAVLTPRGKVLHAETPAKKNLASLTDAVTSSERARGKMRRLDSNAALQTWAALVDGQWSVVESIERDGKRLLLARRNPPPDPSLQLVTGQEANVAWLAAMGHSNKYIAYELGLTQSAVAARLRRALHKMHFASRAELVRTLGIPPGE